MGKSYESGIKIKEAQFSTLGPKWNCMGMAKGTGSKPAPIISFMTKRVASTRKNFQYPSSTNHRSAHLPRNLVTAQPGKKQPTPESRFLKAVFQKRSLLASQSRAPCPLSTPYITHQSDARTTCRSPLPFGFGMKGALPIIDCTRTVAPRSACSVIRAKASFEGICHSHGVQRSTPRLLAFQSLVRASSSARGARTAASCTAVALVSFTVPLISSILFHPLFAYQIFHCSVLLFRSASVVCTRRHLQSFQPGASRSSAPRPWLCFLS